MTTNLPISSTALETLQNRAPSLSQCEQLPLGQLLHIRSIQKVFYHPLSPLLTLIRFPPPSLNTFDMSYSINDTASVLAELEANSPARHPPPPPPQSIPSQALVPMEVAGPILSHISEIVTEAEATAAAIVEDMELSTVGYVARRAIAMGRDLESQINLAHLNNLFAHVVQYATSETITEYLDGVEKERLEIACNSVSIPSV